MRSRCPITSLIAASADLPSSETADTDSLYRVYGKPYYTRMPSHLLYFDQIPEDALESARRRFFIEGESVADWARERGFSLQLTYSVLNGRLRARRGQSHRIAVALGLKPAGSATHAAPLPNRAQSVECAP